MDKINLAIIFVLAGILTFLGVIFLWHKNTVDFSSYQARFWNLQSIDTVKFSRDPARQYADDPSFDKTIDLQVKAVADSGANYIAIGTPYDPEFVPFLRRWVNTARKYGLSVWFRGNFSGWEGWFNYPKIGRVKHEAMLKQFILDNGNLFEDGDIFTACTECENGGSGDPRQNGDVAGHRQFLKEEYQIARNAFAQIGKNVATNYFPMNADVARLVMDPATTQALGGIVVIDHYVATPEELNQGVNDLAESSGGKVILGEFGAPIPDLQGSLTEEEQANWIKNALSLLSKNHNLIGLNYWTSFGGSTELWNDDNTPRLAEGIVKGFFNPNVLRGVVINEAGSGIPGATVVSADSITTTDKIGRFYLPYDSGNVKANVMATGYYTIGVTSRTDKGPITVTLKLKKETLIFKIQKLLYKYFLSL